jgi:hypothetical protein
MKAPFFRLVTLIVIIFSTTNCTTVYDQYGYPYETVDPAAAVVGAAAVGLLAYGLANSSNYNDRCYARPACNYRPNRGYYRYNNGRCRY